MHVVLASDATNFSNQGQVLLNLAVGVALPVLVALVTAKVANKTIKSLALLALAAVGGLLTNISVSDFHWKDFLTGFAIQFLSAVASHYGFLKPVGVTGSDGVIQTLVPSGVGDSPAPVADPTPAPVIEPGPGNTSTTDGF
jgi:hypothetical protein